jgi:AraC-like DNA-binding protein
MKHLGFASIPSAQQYLRYADAKKINAPAAIIAAGIDPAVLKNENGRIKGAQFQDLIKALIAASDDPLMGLNSSMFVQPGSYSVLGYISMSCATIGDAIQRIPPFERLVGDMGITTVKNHQQDVFLHWACAYTDTIVRQHMIDNVLASWTNFARWLANQQASPKRIQLERPKPEPALAKRYEDFFACPVEFNASGSGVLLERSLLDTPLRQPDKLLLKTLENHANQQISSLNEATVSFSTQVKSHIRAQLNMGSARKELIADELGMTARTLQRKLLAEGSAYQQILNEIRLELASDLLNNSSLAIQDIAYNLGFSDGRSFHRSFKSWTGKTPGQFRSEQHPN